MPVCVRQRGYPSTGQAKPVDIWNVLGPLDDATDPRREATADFSRAMELFARDEYDDAREVLERIARDAPDDTPTQIFLKLSRQCSAQGAQRKWEGLDVSADGIVRLEPWRSENGHHEP